MLINDVAMIKNIEDKIPDITNLTTTTTTTALTAVENKTKSKKKLL